MLFMAKKVKRMKQISEDEFKVKVLSRLSAIAVALAISAFSIVMSFAMFIIQNYQYITQLLPPLLSGLIVLILILYLAFRR